MVNSDVSLLDILLTLYLNKCGVCNTLNLQQDVLINLILDVLPVMVISNA